MRQRKGNIRMGVDSSPGMNLRCGMDWFGCVLQACEVYDVPGVFDLVVVVGIN